MKKIAILFSGKGTNFAHIVKTLHKKELEITLALTDNPQAEGISVAIDANIPHGIIDPKQFMESGHTPLEAREHFDDFLVRQLKVYQPDLVVLAGFMRILTPVFTEQIRAINLHPSLLPRQKGLHAIEKSFEDEYAEGGVSVHWVTAELDGGEIIVQKRILKEGLDFETYYEKVRTIEKQALVEAIGKVLSD